MHVYNTKNLPGASWGMRGFSSTNLENSKEAPALWDRGPGGCPPFEPKQQGIVGTQQNNLFTTLHMDSQMKVRVCQSFRQVGFFFFVVVCLFWQVHVLVDLRSIRIPPFWCSLPPKLAPEDHVSHLGRVAVLSQVRQCWTFIYLMSWVWSLTSLL